MRGKNGNQKSDGAEPKGQPGEGAIPVVIVGAAPEGRAVAAAILRHHQLELVACTEGPAAEVLPGGRGVVRDLRGALAQARGGVVVLCVGPSLDDVEGPLEAALDAGLHVVAVCDELAYPWFTDSEFATAVDERAADLAVGVLGVGSAFGGVMERLAATLGSAAGELRQVRGGSSLRFEHADEAQLKRMGVGATETAFERAVDEGDIGVVGLSEACALLAEGLDLPLDEVEETIDPIIAETATRVGGLSVAAGAVCGLRQIAQGFDEGREVVRLTFEAGPSLEPNTWIRIEGAMPLELTLPGGLSAEAMGWAVANSIPTVVQAEPGLLSVLDLPAGR